MIREIVLIAHNLRSTHNVGSLLRTAEGLGIQKVYLTGYTPYPLTQNDTRMPHLAAKLAKQINKTALGAETSLQWEHVDDVISVVSLLKANGFEIIGLEQVNQAISLPDYTPTEKVAVLVGREVEGLEPEVVEACNKIVEIPMFGQKESFNVVQAAAMALYHCRFAVQ
ncbi:MAG: hypothetical protein JWS12_690 [Candidatus Saccharibacteria bacterium]|nr:hypothetical protein [Candidatus Saccharibacteria bacterium]